MTDFYDYELLRWQNRNAPELCCNYISWLKNGTIHGEGVYKALTYTVQKKMLEMTEHACDMRSVTRQEILKLEFYKS